MSSTVQSLSSSDLNSLVSDSIADGGLSVWSNIAKSLRTSVSTGTGLPQLSLSNPIALADKFLSQYIVN